MSGVSFSLATEEDDSGIRRLLATNPMPGRIRIRFEREPDYFAGCAAMGPFTQVIVARDGVQVVGVACRAVRQLFINGAPESIGYLGQLRIDPRYRGLSLVARGFRMMRQLHADGRTRGYVTTIVDGNDEATGVLVRRPRRGMPRYSRLGTLLTLAIRTAAAKHPVQMLQAGEARTFLLEHGSRRNFFPADSPVDPAEELEFIGVERDGRLVGVAAVNDQRASRQTVIDGYAPFLTLARPLYNLASRFTRTPSLPAAGSALRSGYASFFCLAEDDPGVAHELIQRLLERGAAMGLDHLLFGFTAGDPLLAVAQQFHPIEYPSAIYTVAWDDEDPLHDRLDSRPCALELSAL